MLACAAKSGGRLLTARAYPPQEQSGTCLVQDSWSELARQIATDDAEHPALDMVLSPVPSSTMLHEQQAMLAGLRAEALQVSAAHDG